MGEWFQKFRDVPEKYRGQIRQDMGRLFTARERAATQSYFALPPAQRQAEMDRRIKAEEARKSVESDGQLKRLPVSKPMQTARLRRTVEMAMGRKVEGVAQTLVMNQANDVVVHRQRKMFGMIG